MFASVRQNQIIQQQQASKKAEKKQAFEPGPRDSYQACGTFGFTRKDFKLS